MRDGALTMRTLQETSAGNWSDIESTVKAYIGWVVNNMMVRRRADFSAGSMHLEMHTPPEFLLRATLGCSMHNHSDHAGGRP